MDEATLPSKISKAEYTATPLPDGSFYTHITIYVRGSVTPEVSSWALEYANFYNYTDPIKFINVDEIF